MNIGNRRLVLSSQQVAAWQRTAQQKSLRNDRRSARVFNPTPVVASRLFESIYSRSLGLASQASTCHRFAVKNKAAQLGAATETLRILKPSARPTFEQP